MSDGEVGVFRNHEMDHDLRESVTNDTATAHCNKWFVFSSSILYL